MIKCKCVKCGDESVFEDHKKAWFDGWDFVNNKSYCGKCSCLTTSSNTDKPDDTFAVEVKCE